MQTILLYGHLGKQFGRVHRYDVRNVAEAVRALCATLKGFRQAIKADGAYRVLVGGKDSLDAERLADPVSQKETIRIVPVVAGAGRGAGHFIVGALLVAAAVFIPTSIPAINASLATGISVTTMASFASTMGIAMMVGGVTQMLMKAPKVQSSERPENRPSFAFNGAINTVTQGNPIPVFYGGPMIIGSQVVSAGLSVEQM